MGWNWKASCWTSACISALLLVGSALSLGLVEWSLEADPFRRLDGGDSEEGGAYPDDLLISKPYDEAPAEEKSLVVVHIVLIGYMLLGLNTVCDVFFCGAIDMMVDRWEVQPDVAGATFMAAGGSAPELFTALIGACITENDVGFGTIVGSAVFNVLAVIGACGLSAKVPISLTWWPLFRDCTFYILGLGLLAMFASGPTQTYPDGRKEGGGYVELWEAILLFFTYILYCTMMYYNERIERDLTGFLSRWHNNDAGAAGPTRVAPAPPPKAEARSPEAWGNVAPPMLSPMSTRSVCSVVTVNSITEGGGSCRTSRHSHHATHNLCNTLSTLSVCNSVVHENSITDGGASWSASPHTHHKNHVHMSRRLRRSSFMHSRSLTANMRPAELERTQNEPMEPAPMMPDVKRDDQCNDDNLSLSTVISDDIEALMIKPKGTTDLIIWCFSLPIYAPLYYGIPKPTERWFLVSFFVSLLWIAGFSFVLVYCVELFGTVVLGGGNKATILMSLTVLASGTSIPDLVSSMSVARDGEGDMAVSSSIGSNIFDILVGLPIPWIIKIIFVEQVGNGNSGFGVPIKSPYISLYVLLLLFMTSCVICSIHCLGWVLNWKLGLCMGLLYVLFLSIVLPIELINKGPYL